MNLRSLPVLALLTALLATVACAPAGHEATRPPAGRDSSAVARADHHRTVLAVSVLREWDRRRSRAWSRADASGLAGLYTEDSRSGRHDRAMLTAWSVRGLRVTGLRTQVLGVSLRRWRPGRLTVEVTDRLAAARAVGRGGPVSLPRDQASTRVISLLRVAGDWLVDEVREPTA